MRTWLTRSLIGTMAVASIATAPVALASPHQHHAVKHHIAHATRATDTTTSENASENTAETPGSGTENDSAAQSAACGKAGVDPNGSNVQYDGQTGTCNANGGGGAGGQTQQ